MPPFKLHTRPTDRQRIVVRVGMLEKTLEDFNQEIATKTSLLLAQYDGRFVKPLRRRLDWLEKPLVVRAWIVTKRAALFVASGQALAWWRKRRGSHGESPKPEDLKPDIATVPKVPTDGATGGTSEPAEA